MSGSSPRPPAGVPPFGAGVRPASSRGRFLGSLGAWGALAIAVLAVIETVGSWLAPGQAPSDADWQEASALVRAQFRPGDLIVAAPAWADPLLRLHLGDLLPLAAVTRMDEARFGRIWEIGQRGAHVLPPGPGHGGGPGEADAANRVAFEARAGRLLVRRIERPAAAVTYDFLDRWREARVSRRDDGRAGGAGPSAGVAGGQADVGTACPWGGDRFLCPGGPAVRLELVEVDTRIRRAILAPPPTQAQARLILEFPAVPLGRTLALAAGLHDVWARKYATGTVHLTVFVAGRRAGDLDVGNRSGWAALRIDTSAAAGQTVAVRFEIASARPELRHFSLAGEARL